MTSTISPQCRYRASQQVFRQLDIQWMLPKGDKELLLYIKSHKHLEANFPSRDNLRDRVQGQL